MFTALSVARTALSVARTGLSVALTAFSVANVESNKAIVKSINQVREKQKLTDATLDIFMNTTRSKFMESDEMHAQSDSKHKKTKEELIRAKRRLTKIESELIHLRARGMVERGELQNVGKPFDVNTFEFFDYAAGLEAYAEGYLERVLEDSRRQLYIFLKTEHLEAHGFHKQVAKNVESVMIPVIYAIECKDLPIDYIGQLYNVTSGDAVEQFSVKRFIHFEEAGLEWKKVGEMHFLTSDAPNAEIEDKCPIRLPLMTQSKIDALKPEPVGLVEINYKGFIVGAKTLADIETETKQYIEAEDRLSGEDYAPIAAALEHELELRKKTVQDSVDSERRFFDSFLKRTAEDKEIEVDEVKAHLEEMKVYKIYPKYDVNGLPRILR